MEAKVTVYSKEGLRTLFTALDSDIAQLLIVSSFEEVANGDVPANAIAFDDVAIVVEHATGEVCVRCRRTDETVGSNENSNLKNVCNHCAEILEKYFPEAVAEGFEE